MAGDLRAELKGAIDCDPASWEIMSTNGCGEGFADWWGALKRRDRARRADRLRDPPAERQPGVVGTSSYLNIRKLHKGLEVGSTFLHLDARSGPVNPESKRLMLGHAFDAGAIRVEFMIDERNSRSQAAIEKLGADREGELRNHKITWTGHVRDTAVFSITDADWPGVKQRLDFRLQETFA